MTKDLCDVLAVNYIGINRASDAMGVPLALARVLTEPSFKENAARISESFRSCGGVKEAKAFPEEITA